MNAERLRAIVEFLLDLDKKSGFQNQLEALAASMTKLAASNAPENQTDTMRQLHDLEIIANREFGSLTPAQKHNVAEVNTTPHFSEAIVQLIKMWMAENPMTPAVVLDQLKGAIEDRKSTLNVLRNVRSGLRNLGIEKAVLEPGQTEISVLLPRTIHNDLEGLQKELKVLTTIIRAFYSISNVTPGVIEVKEISTSDPTFFLGIDITPLIAIAIAIKWCIDVIKGSYDVKKIAEAARKLNVDEDIVKRLESEIQTKIDARVDERVKELLEGFRGDEGRRNELEKPTKMALQMMLERIERGMVIEIRATPPTLENDPSPEAARLAQQFAELKEIASTIEYPQIQGEPMLQLTTGEDGSPRIEFLKPAAE
jgi:hypothetical protein